MQQMFTLFTGSLILLNPIGLTRVKFDGALFLK
jgi:hypothetical protein